MKKKIVMFITVPIILIFIYFGLSFGYINPMIKGLDIYIIGGTFITNINKYVIKVGDRVMVSPGDYIVVPEFSKKPKLKFAVLDNNDIISIEGNTLIAKKEGYSSIGIINKNRVLRKATIMVVNPKINNMQVKIEKPLKYFGDKSNILGTVDIEDYKKLEKGYKFNYYTNNKKVLKVTGNTVEAVGVGEAKLISKYDREESQTSVKIYPKVTKLEIDKEYDLEVGQKIHIDPKIETLPENEKSKVNYKILSNSKSGKYDNNKLVHFGESGLETSYGVSIDGNGIVQGNREGRYLLEVSSGEKVKKASLIIKEKSFKNIVIENLQYNSSIKNNVLNVELGWDYDNEVNNYRIYVKNEDTDDDYKLFDSVSTVGRNISVGRRISELVKLDIGSKKNYNYKIYVVGYNGERETLKSNIINLNSEEPNDFQNKQVKDLKYNIDIENSTIEFNWKPINSDNYKYRIYCVNRNYKEENYRLIAKNINKNRAILKFDEHDINYDFYVVAVNQKGQISKMSKPVRIETYFSE
ncbi:fibronectin type III domain-containing protein [Peptostreptococcus faecalis]|uniref:fibronectin type III domain-containing protein n=1 Tax=Peptostreptococcus faecalis TaxID=2045015 RepID=UPI000C7C9240|nr:fibronectin type III domain-containing protein [Peptostreptococcus faecalis]